MKKTGDKTIRQFIRKTITESLAPTETFTTQVEGKNIYLYQEDVYEKFKDLSLGAEEVLDEVVQSESAKVFWSLNLDLREAGIKDITLSIENVIIDIQIASEGDAGFQTITLNAVEEDFNIVNELKISQGSSIFPYSIDVNFASKEITVA